MGNLQQIFVKYAVEGLPKVYRKLFSSGGYKKAPTVLSVGLKYVGAVILPVKAVLLYTVVAEEEQSNSSRSGMRPNDGAHAVYHNLAVQMGEF